MNLSGTWTLLLILALLAVSLNFPSLLVFAIRSEDEEERARKRCLACLSFAFIVLCFVILILNGY